MNKVYILLFCLVGCSSNSIWVKNGSPTYDTNELDSAMVLCDYKAKIRASNVLTLGAMRSPPPRVLSTEEGNGKRELNDQTKKSDEKLISANRKKKLKSMKISRAVYGCMKKEGFEKE